METQSLYRSREYILLKRNRDDVEKAVKTDLVWFAKELNKDDVAILNDSDFNVVTDPKSMTSEDDKAMLIVKRLLNRVDLDKDALKEFVEILKKKKGFATLIAELGKDEIAQ